MVKIRFSEIVDGKDSWTGSGWYGSLKIDGGLVINAAPHDINSVYSENTRKNLRFCVVTSLEEVAKKQEVNRMFKFPEALVIEFTDVLDNPPKYYLVDVD